jgi:hypothetical protein
MTHQSKDFTLGLGFVPNLDEDTVQCVQYICNLCFSDVLDTCKNTKFPGTMVASLSRKDLSSIKGVKSTFQVYKSSDILPWLSPVQRHIPALKMDARKVSATDRQKPVGTLLKSSMSLPDVLRFDFGDSSGLFVPFDTCMYPATSVDFGSDDNFFSDFFSK